MRVIQGRTVFGLVSVVISILITSTHLNLLNFKTLFVDFKQLIKILGVTIIVIFGWFLG